MVRIMKQNRKKITALGNAILALVHQRPRSGYDVRKTFEGSPLSHYSSSPGSIYPALRRLEQLGLVKGTTEREHTLRPRKVFEVTDDGLEALREWLLAPVNREDVIWRLEELILRFAFMGDLLSNAETGRFLQSLILEIESYLPELESFYDAEAGAMPMQGRLALESGIERYRGLLEWSVRSLQCFS